jgi:AcrR family transcriptional regulator
MPPRKGQRQARGLARRQQILDTSLELFAANGFRSTSLATIANAVGLTEAGILHHFASKDALVLAVLAHRDSAEPDAEAHVAEPGGGLESLRRIPTLAQVLLDQPVLMRFDSVVGGESIAEGGAVLEYFRDRMRQIRQALAGMLKEGIRRGELRNDVDVDGVATEIVAFMDGIQTQWLLDPQGINLITAYKHYIDNLAAQLRSPQHIDSIRDGLGPPSSSANDGAPR